MPVTALGPARLPPVQPVAEAGLALPGPQSGRAPDSPSSPWSGRAALSCALHPPPPHLFLSLGVQGAWKVPLILYRFLSDSVLGGHQPGRGVSNLQNRSRRPPPAPPWRKFISEGTLSCFVVFNEHFPEPFPLFLKLVNDVLFWTFINMNSPKAVSLDLLLNPKDFV